MSIRFLSVGYGDLGVLHKICVLAHRSASNARIANAEFGGGNRYGLIGANGCGKSVFMKILGGELEPGAGTMARWCLLSQSFWILIIVTTYGFARA